jgi:hypothetical protein
VGGRGGGQGAGHGGDSQGRARAGGVAGALQGPLHELDQGGERGLGAICRGDPARWYLSDVARQGWIHRWMTRSIGLMDRLTNQ